MLLYRHLAQANRFAVLGSALPSRHRISKSSLRELILLVSQPDSSLLLKANFFQGLPMIWLLGQGK